MIGEYTLKKLCDKYGLNADKLIKKNNNILDYGEYLNIDKTLDYLINVLKINSNNIEKCPSILYRNVRAIKENIDFLKNLNINFSDIETCLHVLSAEPSELKETYEYVKDNYGLAIINRLTSILSVPKSVICSVENLGIPFVNKNGNLSVAVGVEWGSTNIEEVQKIIQSPEFKAHPELFTSTTLSHAKLEEIQNMIQSPEFKAHPELFTSQTLAHAKLEEIQKIIQSSEFKAHPELFTSTTLAHAKLEEIQKIIQSPEFKAYPELFKSETLARTKLGDIQKIIQSPEFKEHPELFTSQTLARTKLEEIQKIIQSSEFKAHPELFTSQTLAHAKLDEIQKIIQSPEFKAHPELFTSTTLARTKLGDIQKIIQSPEFKEHPEFFTSTTLASAKLEDIQQLLQMECWQDPRFKTLLSPSIVAKSKRMIDKIPILIKLAEDNEIDNFLNTSFLIFSPSQNYAIIEYLKTENKPLVIDGKLNPIFGKQSGVLKKKYGIDLKAIMQQFPFDITDNLSKNGEIKK